MCSNTTTLFFHSSLIACCLPAAWVRALKCGECCVVLRSSICNIVCNRSTAATGIQISATNERLCVNEICKCRMVWGAVASAPEYIPAISSKPFIHPWPRPIPSFLPRSSFLQLTTIATVCVSMAGAQERGGYDRTKRVAGRGNKL